MVITRGRLFAIVGLVCANGFASCALGGFVPQISRDSAVSYTNSMGGTPYGDGAQDGGLLHGVSKRSVTFDKIDAAGSSGSTLSQETTDVELSNGSLFTSGQLLTQVKSVPVGNDTVNLGAAASHTLTFQVADQLERFRLEGDFGTPSADGTFSTVRLEFNNSASDYGSIFNTNSTVAPRFDFSGILEPGSTYTLRIQINADAFGQRLADKSTLNFSFEADPAVSAIPLPPAVWPGLGLLTLLGACSVWRDWGSPRRIG